jgi:hypothetical protein
MANPYHIAAVFVELTKGGVFKLKTREFFSGL